MQLSGTQHSRDLQQTHMYLLEHKMSVCVLLEAQRKKYNCILFAFISIYMVACLFSMPWCMWKCMYKCVCMDVCVCVWYLLVEHRGVRQDFIQTERLLIAQSVQRGCACMREKEREGACRTFIL